MVRQLDRWSDMQGEIQQVLKFLDHCP